MYEKRAAQVESYKPDLEALYSEGFFGFVSARTKHMKIWFKLYFNEGKANLL